MLPASVRRLESVKEEILAYWASRTDRSEVERSMKSGDAKEAYFTIVAASEMVGPEEFAASLAHFLDAARSRFSQAASSLFADDTAKALQARFREAFEAAWNELAAHRRPVEPKPDRPVSPIVRIGPREFHLRCQECGRMAARFHVEKDRFEPQRGELLMYMGIVMGSSLPLAEAEPFFALLERGDLAGVHARMATHRVFEDGMDAWCPDCRRVYCRTHYKVEEVWDDGFYEASTGTCPFGHQRELDD